MCAERGERERHEQAEPGDELGPVLPPCHPCHRRGNLSGGFGCGSRSGRHVREQQLLEADALDRPRRVDDRAVARRRAASADGRCGARARSRATPRIVPIGRRGPIRIRCDSSSDSTWPSSRTRPSASRTMSSQTRSMSAMTCEAITTVGAVSATPSISELQELAAGERIEPRERLVEQQQPRPLPERRAPARAACARPADSAPTFVRESRRVEQARRRTRASQRGFVRRANSIASHRR